MRVYYLTEEGKSKYQKKKDHLLTEVRELRERLKGRRQKRDSCNNGIHSLKDSLGQDQASLKKIKEILDNSEIVKNECFDRVEIGAKVRIEFEDGESIYFVGITDPDINNILSIGSLLFDKLIGKKVGETVFYKNKGRQRKLTIKDIS